MAQRIPVPRFIGGTGRLKSSQVSVERAINRYQESTNGLGGKVERYLRQAEGLSPFAEILDADTSELFYQDGRAFACCGTTFAEVFANGTTLVRGTIAYNGTKATMVSNGGTGSGAGPSVGHQIGICSAGLVYIYDSDSHVFTQVDFLGVVIAMLEYIDGYMLALALNSRRVFYSSLFNGLTWDFGFGYIERSWGADNINFIKRSGRQIWLVGTKTTEVWADTGNASNPFAPIQGAFLDIGSIAAFAGQRDGETISWLNQDERGGGLVVRASGYQPQQISTYPLAIMVQQALTVGTLSLCEAFVHQIEGHRFYWLHVDNIDTTPVFDFIEQEWHERAMWNTADAVFEPHIARCHTYAFERHLVGVEDSGILYELSPNVYDDSVVA